MFKKDKQPKITDLNHLLATTSKPKFELPQNMSAPVLPTPAYAYDLHVGELQSDIVLSLETGHVLSIDHKFPQPVKYCFQPHGTKVLKSEYCQFDLSTLATLSVDKTWALWTPLSKSFAASDSASDPSPVVKIKCPQTPNTLLTLPNRKILLGDVTPSLKVYSL